MRVVYAASVQQSLAQRHARPSRYGGWRLVDAADGDEVPRDEVAALLTASKHAAMWREAKKFFGSQPWCNILSVGDGPYEARALRDLALRRDEATLRTKVQTCVRDPTIEGLTARLNEDASLLALLVRHNDDLDMMENSANRRRFLRILEN